MEINYADVKVNYGHSREANLARFQELEVEVGRLEADELALRARERELMLEVWRLTNVLEAAQRELARLQEASRPVLEPPHNWLNRGIERVGRIMP